MVLPSSPKGPSSLPGQKSEEVYQNALKLSLDGGAVQGLELVKDLAELERKLANKLDEARRAAEQRIAGAEEEARRILASGDAEVRQMGDVLKTRIAKESERYAEEGRTHGEAEAERIRQQADSNIERAVEYVLSEVLP